MHPNANRSARLRHLRAYENYPAGEYIAEFVIRPAEGERYRDRVRVALDVVSNFASTVHAKADVSVGRLASGRPMSVTLPFTLQQPANVEFRVFVSGKVSLIVEDHVCVANLVGGKNPEASLNELRFPDAASHINSCFLEHEVALRKLHEKGALLAIEDKYVTLAIDGVRFQVKSFDDMRFVDDIFFNNEYNVILNAPTCAECLRPLLGRPF